jgi:hypothetical protein
MREGELAGLEETAVIMDPDDPPVKTIVSKDCNANFNAQGSFKINPAYSSSSLQFASPTI